MLYKHFAFVTSVITVSIASLLELAAKQLVINEIIRSCLLQFAITIL